MTLIRRLLLGAATLTAAFILWLLAVWPPPVWYATHFPARTAFMGMRDRAEPAVSDTAREAVPAFRTPPPLRPVPLDSIRPAVITAVLRGEDHRFFDHAGLDWIELRRAIGYPRDSFHWGNARHRADLERALRATLRDPGTVRGASTITQQLAKNLYLSPSRNPLRKLKEAVTAWRLELALSKERILELYLNVAEFGPGVWGVAAASEVYFGKPPSRLTRAEAAALAGTLPFPLTSNPSFRPGRMRWRQRMILGRM